MAKKEFEFTLVLSGISDLSDEVVDALYEAGCDDALIGMRGGIAFADFTRAAESPEKAIESAIRDVERAGVGATVEHIEPDEVVNMSEIARRFRMSREGVRKWMAGTRGPYGFPAPVAGLKQRSPLWRWTEVLWWYKEHQPAGEGSRIDDWAGHIAAYNAALTLRRLVPMDKAIRIMQRISEQRQSTTRKG